MHDSQSAYKIWLQVTLKFIHKNLIGALVDYIRIFLELGI